MRIGKKTKRSILFFIYIAIAVKSASIMIDLLLKSTGFWPDVIPILFFEVVSLYIINFIIPKWYYENFWYCEHCKRYRWLKSKYELVNNDIKTHKLCEKCNNEIHTLDYYN